MASTNSRATRITAALYIFIVPSTVVAYLAINYLIAKAGKSIAVVNVVTIVCCLIPTVGFGMAVMGEKMTVGKVVGLAAILAGSTLLGFGGSDSEDDEDVLVGASGSGLNSSEELFGTVGENGDGFITITAAKQAALMITIAVFYGVPTILFTYGPKVIKSSVSGSLLWASGGLLTALFSAVAGATSNGNAFDHTQTLLVVLAGTLTAFGGNGCYAALAKSGMEGTTLAPIVMLYPIVPIFVGVALGELLSAITSIGLALILGAILVLSREIG
jgi:drug/metabolite transporter (DMT)-like permease